MLDPAVDKTSTLEEEATPPATHFMCIRHDPVKLRLPQANHLGIGDGVKPKDPPWMTFKFRYRSERKCAHAPGRIVHTEYLTESLESHRKTAGAYEDLLATIAPHVWSARNYQPLAQNEVASNPSKKSKIAATKRASEPDEASSDSASSWNGTTDMDTEDERTQSDPAASSAIRQRGERRELDKQRITPFLEPTPSVRTFSPNPLFDSSDFGDTDVELGDVTSQQAIALPADREDGAPRGSSNEQQTAPLQSAIKREPSLDSEEDGAIHGRRSPQIKREIDDDGDNAASDHNGTPSPADRDNVPLTVATGKKRKLEDTQTATPKKARTTAEQTRQLIAERRRELEERRRMRIQAQEAAIAIQREALFKLNQEEVEVETQIQLEETRLQELRATLQTAA